MKPLNLDIFCIDILDIFCLEYEFQRQTFVFRILRRIVLSKYIFPIYFVDTEHLETKNGFYTNTTKLALSNVFAKDQISYGRLSDYMDVRTNVKNV